MFGNTPANSNNNNFGSDYEMFKPRIGVIVDTKKLNEVELENLSRAYIRGIGKFIGPKNAVALEVFPIWLAPPNNTECAS